MDSGRGANTSSLSIKRFWRACTTSDADLSAQESASTLFRFFRSKHVIDLKLIVKVVFYLFVVHFILVFVFGALDAKWPPKDTSSKWVEFFSFLIKYIGPALGVTGLIIGWAYRSASARLGVVDLFACEISTLCRVGTIFDIGKLYVDQYNAPPIENHAGMDKKPATSDTFVSKEDYFPIFESNSRDLQLLEALVVKNITEFYTYMKATRDCQRVLAGTEPAQPATASPGTPYAEGNRTPRQRRSPMWPSCCSLAMRVRGRPSRT
jgi:hypothetical protein